MNKTYYYILGLMVACLCGILPMQAQKSLTLQEAQQLALQHYPAMRAARLNTQSQQALTPSAFDLGETELSTGGEEIGKGNEATYTLIALRQNFDIFSISAKKGFLKQQVKVAEAEELLIANDLKREVGIDYANALVAHRRTLVYQHLDSIYRDFEKAARLRYETEATSKLEYISAQQQVRQIVLALNEARKNEAIALQNLTRWWGEEKASMSDGRGANAEFLVLSDADIAMQVSDVVLQKVSAHPSLVLASEKVKLAEQQTRAEKAEYLPKLYLQGGAQKIGDKSGYWQYEVGVSMPLFSRGRGAKAKAGKLQQEAEVARQQQAMLQLKSELKTLVANDEKWSEQLKYYREVELPLADEQQRVAIQSYRQGATDYIGFIANMKEAVKVQLDYWNTYGDYLNNRMQLLYY